MKETILLFQFDTVRQKKLVCSLMPLRMKIKVIKPEEYHQPIGYLAGLREAAEPMTENTEKKDMLSGEMLVMAGLSGSQIDQVLSAIRKSGIGPVPYKAVLTDTNKDWDAYALLAELKREHEKMSQNKEKA